MTSQVEQNFPQTSIPAYFSLFMTYSDLAASFSAGLEKSVRQQEKEVGLLRRESDSGQSNYRIAQIAKALQRCSKTLYRLKRICGFLNKL